MAKAEVIFERNLKYLEERLFREFGSSYGEPQARFQLRPDNFVSLMAACIIAEAIWNASAADYH